VEAGRWVVQAAPTGYSVVVDQRGRVVAQGPLGDRAVVTEIVELRAGRTLAMRLGDRPGVAAAAMVIAFGWWRSRKLSELDSGMLPSLRRLR
jgi:apolipoprotein N-acyltransferase